MTPAPKGYHYMPNGTLMKGASHPGKSCCPKCRMKTKTKAKAVQPAGKKKGEKSPYK